MIDSTQQQISTRREASAASVRRVRARQRAAGKVNVSFAMSGDIVAAVDRLKAKLGAPARANVFEIAIRRLVDAERSTT